MNFALKLVVWCHAAVMLAAAPMSAFSSTYPNKNINLVVVFGPGGTSDTVARVVGQSLSDALQQQVVVENRPGAGGNIGANHVAKAPADGYTLLAGFPGLTTNGALYRKLNYDPQKDFEPISLIASAPNVIVVSADSNVDSLQKLIEQGKTRKDALNFGSAGPGTSSHLAGELLKEMTGAKMQHIPYKGGAAALTDLASGRLDVMIIPLPESIGLIRSGKLKALALASSERSALIPEIPTTKEAGLSDFELGSWYGLLAPAGTPNDVILKLNGVAQQALLEKGVKDTFKSQGIEIIGSTPKKFDEFLRAETQRWGAVIEKNQIHLD
jgi:tripartite-type tricarboxylate transporter receptor subunit TctC